MMKFGHPQKGTSITIWVDNEEALTGAKEYQLQLIKLKEYDVSDYNKKIMMQQLIKEMSQYITLDFQKVKGHQQGEDHELPFEAKLNNMADELAQMI